MAQGKDIVDVLVIGAGASGAAFVWSLAEAGIDVMCLEQGGWVDPASYPSTLDNWEIHRQTDFNPDPNFRRLPQDYPVNDSESPIAPLMYNAVGGSTIHWSAHFPRLHPSDFRVRSLDGVADDWPLTYEQLEPYFDLNDRIMGIAGVTGDTAYPAKSDRQTPPVPLGKLGDTIVSGFEKLGWHWWPGNNAIASQAHGDQDRCERYGTCVGGCPAGAKGSTDVTHWPAAIRSGAQLVTGARVKEVTLDEQGLANGAVYFDREGLEQFQPASLVIMAANGIGTPRILLMSRSHRFPNGLANSSGLVGKRLMLHPCAAVAGVFDDEFDELGPSGQKIGSMQFYESDASRGFVRGAYWTMYDGIGPHLHMLRRTLSEGFGREPFWGAPFPAAMKEVAHHTLMWGLVAEDLPEEHNQVTLDSHKTDSDGLPAARITYTLSDNTRRLIDFHCHRAMESLDAAGARRSFVFSRNIPSGHLLGTARMGSDPKFSIVDRWGRSHDVPNLYIVDGSVFVTGFGVNPTSSIAAIAKRTATHLVDTAGVQEVSA